MNSLRHKSVYDSKSNLTSNMIGLTTGTLPQLMKLAFGLTVNNNKESNSRLNEYLILTLSVICEQNKPLRFEDLNKYGSIK